MDLQDKVKEGVYIMLGGPNFETPAELRMLKLCGVDAVGMSTVHEVITARHCGLRVFAFSLITNTCVIQQSSTSPAATVDIEEEVFNAAQAASPMLKAFVSRMVTRMTE